MGITRSGLIGPVFPIKLLYVKYIFVYIKIKFIIIQLNYIY